MKTKTQFHQARQGDVLVTRASKLPPKKDLVPRPRENGAVVLAHGEATGHTHHIKERQAGLFDGGGGGAGGKVWLSVETKALLEHQEHAAIALAKGAYEVTRQREYSDADEVRNVAD